jgi:hypothetical protein
VSLPPNMVVLLVVAASGLKCLSVFARFGGHACAVVEATLPEPER